MFNSNNNKILLIGIICFAIILIVFGIIIGFLICSKHKIISEEEICYCPECGCSDCPVEFIDVTYKHEDELKKAIEKVVKI